MWAEAFLAQAKSDWQIYAKLKRANELSCHVLHYLQMATEKLGKAYLLAGKTTIDEVENSHLAFTRFLRFISRNGKLQQLNSPTGLNLLKLVNIVLENFWVLHDMKKRKGAQ